jgi:ABC-type antimicrobial peptide transport system ATPase subunit
MQWVLVGLQARRVSQGQLDSRAQQAQQVFQDPRSTLAQQAQLDQRVQQVLHLQVQQA